MRWLIPAVLLLAAPANAFDLQGHRGARGLAPENTLAAFETALAIGVTTLELDLAMTRDGVLVVSHDRTLNPDHTRGPDGEFLSDEGPAIRSLTLAELQRYDVGRLKPGSAYAASFPEQRAVDGARIPALTELFDLVRRAAPTCALQHRDQDHADLRRRDAGSGDLRGGVRQGGARGRA